MPEYFPGVPGFARSTRPRVITGCIAKFRGEDRAEVSEFVEDRVSTYQGVKDVGITMAIETYKEELLDI